MLTNETFQKSPAGNLVMIPYPIRGLNFGQGKNRRPERGAEAGE
jgi:hypothetical protein